MADRRLDALIEEDRTAMSVPVRPGVRRLELDGVRAQQPSGSSMAGRGDGALPRQEALSGVPDLLRDPRAGNLGLGQLQDAVRQSFEVLRHALGNNMQALGPAQALGPPPPVHGLLALGPPPPVHGLLAPLAQGLDQGNQGGSVPRDRGERLFLQTPLEARSERRAEDRLSEVQRGDGSVRREHSGRSGDRGTAQSGRLEGVA